MDGEKKACAVLMIRSPERGKVKTRLAEGVGEEIALELYKAFILDTLDLLSILDIDIIISLHSDGDPEVLDSLLKDNYLIFKQTGSDLGERQFNSLNEAINMGYEKAIVMVADCPDIESDFILGAIVSLDHGDAVIGPCEDGGYYLLGMKKDTLNPHIFDGVEWGTESVLGSIRSNSRRLGITLFELPLWYDVDTRKDLQRLEIRSSDSSRARRTMEIIPEFPEEEPIFEK